MSPRFLSPEQSASEIAQLCAPGAQTNKRRYRIVFIAGAGLSVPAVPDSRELAGTCAKLCGSDIAPVLDSESPPQKQLAHWLSCLHPDSAARRSFLRSLFDGKPVPPAWLKLGRLIASGRVSNTVITTCFDDFAGRSLELFQVERSVCDTILSIARFQPESEAVAQVFQVHGGVSEYDPARTLPQARDDYRNAVSAKVSSALSGRVPVVMGYSGLLEDSIIRALRERLASLENGFYWYCHSREGYESLPAWLKDCQQGAFVVPGNVGKLSERLSFILGEEAAFISRGLFGSEVEALYALECLERAFGLEAPELAKDPAAFFLARMEELVKSAVGEGADVYFLRESLEKLRRSLSAAAEDPLEGLLNMLRAAKYEQALEQTSREAKTANRERKKALAGVIFQCLQRLGGPAKTQVAACELYSECRGQGLADRTQLLVSLKKSAALLSEGRFADSAGSARAVSGADGAVSCADLRLAAAFLLGESLLKSEGPAHAASALKAAGEEFLGAPYEALRAGAVQACLDAAELMKAKGDKEQAAAFCLQIWSRCSDDHSALVRPYAHDAARTAAELMAELGNGAKALQLFEESLAKIAAEKGREFTDARMPEAILSRAKALMLLGRLEESLSAYESASEVFSDSRLPSMEGKAARALLGRAASLSRLERHEQAIMVYGEVFSRYGASRNREAMDAAGKALLNKGARLAALGRHKEAVAAYDALVRRFKGQNCGEWVCRCSRALLNKALSLKAVQDNKSALDACDEAAAHALSCSDGGAGETARAVFTKGMLLAETNRVTEAADVFEELAACYGSSADLIAREYAAKGLVEAGLAFKKAGRMKNAAEVFERTVELFGGSEVPGVRAAVERAAAESMR